MEKLKKDEMITLKINSKIKKQIKGLCVEKEITMSEQIQLLIVEFLKKNEDAKNEKFKKLLLLEEQIENYYK